MLTQNESKINAVYAPYHDPNTDKITVDYVVTVGTHQYTGSLTECSSIEEANKIATRMQNAYNKLLWVHKLKSGFFNETNFA